MLHHVQITDTGNNYGRHCDVIGVRKPTPRGWRVKEAFAASLSPTPLTPPTVPTHYLLVHEDGTELLAPRDLMTNLY